MLTKMATRVCQPNSAACVYEILPNRLGGAVPASGAKFMNNPYLRHLAMSVPSRQDKIKLTTTAPPTEDMS